MKAAYINQPGPAESIRYGDLPDPQPGDGQVLVRVGAVSVNPVDTYIRSGAIDMGQPMPFVVGCDLAGTVEALGPGVEQLRVGDRVWGSNQGLLGRQGTFSELAAVDACWLYPTPDGVTDREAAATALVAITAHLGLVREAGVQSNEIVFVHGGSGGVGSCVIQIAKALGAQVVATAGTQEKVEACRRLGADYVIDYKSDDVDTALRTFSPDGVDIWFETLREQDLVQAVSHLRMRGRLVLMAGRAATPAFPVGPFYVKDCKVFGFAMFNAPPDQQRRAADDINTWLAEGKLCAKIGRVMKLEETAAAHQLQEENTLQMAGTLAGKIVLEP